ncbi:hypothetical protein [Chitinimonas sp.]|uniref:hypothetical protein n=1 Tax=Chitinimonas sp. TaxID=1934313 RepID=UPI0035B107F7
MDKKPGYWFPAKTYGWGWGLPHCRQGWLIMLAAVFGQISVALCFPPKQSPLVFAAGTFVVVGGLLLVCLLKGEPPHWRRGKQ